MCSFRLVVEKKVDQEISELFRFKFLKNFLLFVNSFALSVVEGGTSGPLERGDNSRFFHRQKLREPSFWEVIDSFVLLVYTSLAALRTLLQR